ncbi:MAG: PQQ-dependent sugar dehydrogenase [Fimbriimonadaceae bacterium]
MDKHIKSAGLLSSAALLIVAALGAAPNSQSQASQAGGIGSQSPQGFQRPKSVTQLYAEHCANCHGQAGEGGGGGTRSILSEEKFDQSHDKALFDAIKNGVPESAMHAYKDSLTDEQIWGLVVRLREFQGRALRAKNGSPKPENGVYRSKRHNFRIETVVEEGKGLRTPWGIDWLPDGRMVVANRPGQILLIEGSTVTGVSGIPKSLESGQGGMMEVAVHPNYRENGWIYLAFTDPAAEGRGSMTKIVRGRLTIEAGVPTWADEQVVFEVGQEFYTRANYHYGTRIVFDGKGHIYFVVGERGTNELAQELTNPFGKTYRIKDDGTIPSDNPFVEKAPADKPYLKGIWSVGHRNPQGLAMNTKGELWDTEHGPRGGDEVNRIEKGANYGWPLVAWSINYNDSPMWSPWPKAGAPAIKQPVFRWLPSTGACGLDVGNGSAFPDWNGDLFAGGLVGQNLDRIRTDGDKLVEREELIHGLGRIREVAVGRDGYVYVALNQPDKIIRLVPAP